MTAERDSDVADDSGVPNCHDIQACYRLSLPHNHRLKIYPPEGGLFSYHFILLDKMVSNRIDS